MKDVGVGRVSSGFPNGTGNKDDMSDNVLPRSAILHRNSHFDTKRVVIFYGLESETDRNGCSFDWLNQGSRNQSKAKKYGSHHAFRIRDEPFHIFFNSIHMIS